MWIHLKESTVSQLADWLMQQGQADEAASLKERLNNDIEQSNDIELYRRIARNCLQRDGDLEFDDNAVVSFSADNGAYVMAWKWIADDEVETWAARSAASTISPTSL